MRYLKITVEKDYGETGFRTVEQVLQRQCNFTKRQIRQAKFRQDGIRKNGFRCRVTEMTEPGDVLWICLEEERDVSVQLEKREVPLEILYEDEDLLAVNKSAGLVTHPQGGHYQDTLANQVTAYFQGKGERHGVRPVGRLDKETSGIMVFAKNQMAAARLQEQRKKGIYMKTYLAVAEGQMETDGKIHDIKLPIAPDPSDRLKMMVCEGGKYAETHYQAVKNADRMAVLEVWLDTGRTHQIRVHMAALGHPLAGDQLYGRKQKQEEQEEQFRDGSDRAALHAWKVELYQPFSGEKIELEAPVPEDMRKYL